VVGFIVSVVIFLSTGDFDFIVRESGGHGVVARLVAEVEKIVVGVAMARPAAASTAVGEMLLGVIAAGVAGSVPRNAGAGLTRARPAAASTAVGEMLRAVAVSLFVVDAVRMMVGAARVAAADSVTVERPAATSTAVGEMLRLPGIEFKLALLMEDEAVLIAVGTWTTLTPPLVDVF
jgi:hypothetical protein